MTTPNSQHTRQPYSSDDEISLIDLAKILVKRWKIFFITFFIVISGTLAYALMQEHAYQYVSIYHVAEQASPQSEPVGLESPVSVIAKMQNLYLGPVIRELREEKGLERLPFEVFINHPDDTLLVRLTTQASKNNAELVTNMHERLLNRVREDQVELLERNRERLEHQLTTAEQALTAAEQADRAGELMATHIQRMAEIESRLAQLNEGKIVQVAVQSLEPTGTSKRLIVMVGIVIGGLLALLAAFFSHFISLVRISLRDEQGN